MISLMLLQQCSASLVRLIWMVLEMEVSCCTAVILWAVASRMCSIELVAFLCSSRQAFFFMFCQRSYCSFVL